MIRKDHNLFRIDDRGGVVPIKINIYIITKARITVNTHVAESELKQQNVLSQSPDKVSDSLLASMSLAQGLI